MDEETRELAIAVVPSSRGLGEAFLNALCDRARADGYRALSLSVDRCDDALVWFYEKHGFVRVAGDGGDRMAMRRQL